MSRTYRRKGKINKNVHWRVTQDLEYCEITHRFEWIELEGKARKKAIAKFHSDVYWLMNAPKWFRQYYNQRFRSRERIVLDTINKKGNYIRYLFNPAKKDASYDYW